jgi:hypothetical protein
MAAQKQCDDKTDPYTQLADLCIVKMFPQNRENGDVHHYHPSAIDCELFLHDRGNHSSICTTEYHKMHHQKP